MKANEKDTRPETLIERHFKYLGSHDNNVFAVFVGPTGSGKTYSALSLAERCDSSFDISRVVFSISDGVRLLKAMIESGNTVNKFVVFEEAGVSLHNTDYRKSDVKGFNFILQVIRSTNIHILFTSPDMGLIAKHTRNLFKAIFHISRNGNTNTGKCLRPVYNLNKGKYYYFPIRVKPGGEMVTKTRFYKPSAKLVKDYEVAKKEFQLSLLESQDAETDDGFSYETEF